MGSVAPDGPVGVPAVGGGVVAAAFWPEGAAARAGGLLESCECELADEASDESDANGLGVVTCDW